MFDVDGCIEDLRRAVTEREPRQAVKEVLTRVLERPDEVAAALPPTRGEIHPLYSAPDLTVLKVIWNPGMYFQPHNHLMWAAIAVYGGQEDNEFFLKTADGIAASGGKVLRQGDVALLGDDVIHAVTNPLRVSTGAIHVYGGDLFATARSEWDPATGAQRPYDVDATLAQFQAANAPD